MMVSPRRHVDKDKPPQDGHIIRPIKLIEQIKSETKSETSQSTKHETELRVTKTIIINHYVCTRIMHIRSQPKKRRMKKVIFHSRF
jgi:hypothetical protein